MFGRLYQQLKNIYHFFQAHLWRTVYGRPDKALHLYGVTGTNGKTTTCHMVAGILAAEYGAEKVGMLTTINVRLGTTENVNETKLTTLPSKLVYSYLRQMKDAGLTHAVLEMTSHALDQHRLAGLQLDGAIITNIEREHLNYHRTMEEYTRTKLRITGYLKPKSPFVYKSDDEWIAKGISSLLGLKDRLRFIPFTTAEAKEVTTPMAGSVNQENALSASKLAAALGVSSSVIQRGIGTVRYVPGRMEEVKNNRGLRIIIDYAVTPAALDRLYHDAKGKTSGKVFALLGAAGLRDRGKRADMAKIVASYTDLLVITREDPWTEPEEQIFQDLEKGLQDTKTKWQRIIDRRAAIEFLLAQAHSGDTVVVTGKGAETGMGVGKDIIPWSDKKIIQESLQKLYDG
ncbi:MAG: hypothetical protein HYR90_01005 [Candidatus Andersenbacteria bacterium]|nr:hypothetical protein [Candidatus Andersenbacteria bacterium]MBI3251172.1 hypothetical protein [Candidatus Andersenbacteria bacterium]